MDDEEQTTGFVPGSGVVITCDVPDGVENYIGYVMGMDDMYLYAKVTHSWGESAAEVTAESVVILRGILEQRPLWLLRVQTLVKARVFPLWLTKEQLVDVMSYTMQQEAIAKAGMQGGFVAEALPMEMSLPHFSVRNIKSLADVMGGSVLAGLDFTLDETYTEESALEEGGEDGDASTEERTDSD